MLYIGDFMKQYIDPDELENDLLKEHARFAELFSKTGDAIYKGCCLGTENSGYVLSKHKMHPKMFGWVQTNEELPKYDGLYLAIIGSLSAENVTTLYFDPDYDNQWGVWKEFFDVETMSICDREFLPIDTPVICWMPIPDYSHIKEFDDE